MRKFSLQIIIYILLLAAPITAAAQEGEGDTADPTQTAIDSLLSLIKPNMPDSTKARLYKEMAELAVNTDSIKKYAQLSLQFCSDDVKLVVRNNQLICFAYYNNGDYDSSMIYLKRNVELCSKADLTPQLLRSYRNIAAIYEARNVSDSTFAYLNKALDICVKTKDTSEIAECYYTLAAFAFNRQLFDNAKRDGQKAAEFYSMTNKADGLAQCNMLLGLVYRGNGADYNDTSLLFQSLDYLKKAINYYTIKTNDIAAIYQKYIADDNISYTYILLAKSTGNKAYADSSYAHYKPAADFFLQNSIIDSYLNCSKTYTEYLLFLKKYKEAEAFALSLGKYVNDDLPLAYKYQYYAQLEYLYETIGDWEKAFKNQKIVNQYAKQYINDSTLNVIAETKAQQAVLFEKMERDKDEQIHAAEKSRMRTLIFSLIGGLVLVSLLVFYILRMLSIKRRANKELSDKNNLLNSQKVEIEAQRDEILSQRDEIAAQKDIITEQWHEVETVNQKLFSSINYAKRIQRAAVSSEEDVHRIFPDSFVFYRPRDIVSGDFYRCGRCGKYSVMITADCTGHGIPGAFLSMLGLSALKEYMVTEYDAENPGTVLDRIRDFIKTTLATSNNGSNVNDGMEMTICCYDYEQMQMRYAIANQTAFIVRGGEAIKLKGDPMPVGRFVVEKEHFQSLSIPIQKGDMIYTFSDGIQDQLGDSKEKRKFSTRQLLSVLTSNADKPMETQCQLLEKAILDWRGNTAQVDDITLVGVRV